MAKKTRPAWADALTSTFLALKNQQPAPLSQLLNALSGIQVSDDELARFISGADENETSLTQARLALAKWDAQEEFEYPPGSNTPPRTAERRKAVYSALHLPAAVADAFSQRVEVYEAPSILITTDEFEPWYEEDRKRRTNMYWDDYEAYLRDVKKWPASSINSLDATSTQVVERLSRPTRPEIKSTRGLVVGYVQSGKTANFTGVAAKAIDAGYRLVIVLTGTIEILRAQTQRRIDMELMGVENILADQDPKDPEVLKELDYQQDLEWLAGHFVSHGDGLHQPGVAEICRVTSHQRDYDRLPQGVTKFKFRRQNKQKPLNEEENLFDLDAYVAVVKKNTAPLKKLIKDLKPLKNDLNHLPVLIIDDESDQASVDTTNPAKWDKTSPEGRKRTAINDLITQILKICPRAQYVGYTATPFANVFVDSDDEHDIFPSNFVLSLDPPPGYMGVQEFHDAGKRWDDEERTVANSNEKAYVRALKGDPDTDEKKRRAELQEALDAWVITGGVKKYRESKTAKVFRHHTMLVHESVFTAEHIILADLIRSIWSTSKFTTTEGFARLKKLYERDTLPVMESRAAGEPIPESFEELKDFIKAAVAEMKADGDPVLIVNGDKEAQAQQKKLDFEKDKVWRVLVGGTQLSRGFTVEGLTISYFRRKAGQADTLMQAGRWFGYRPGYRDLVRLYIRRDETADLYEAFEAMLLDEEAFRAQLKQFEGFDEDGKPLLEPRAIPILVSQHLPWLRPTSRSKMWNAEVVNKAPTDVQDLYGIPARGDGANQENLKEFFIPLLRHANEEVRLDYEFNGKAGYQQPARIGLIGAAEFMQLFKRLKWHPDYASNIAAISGFLRAATDQGKITDWAVVMPLFNKNVRTLEIKELDGDVPVIQRRRRTGRIDFAGSDRKHRAAGRPIAQGKTVPILGGSATRGLCLVSLVVDRDPDELADPIIRDEVVGLLSIAAPVSSLPRKDLIQWTLINSTKPDELVIDKAEGEKLLREHFGR